MFNMNFSVFKFQCNYSTLPILSKIYRYEVKKFGFKGYVNMRVAGQMLTKNAFIYIFALGQGPFTHFFTLQC